MPPDPTSSQLISGLLNPAVYGDSVAAVRVIETHISWVLLTGKIAFKIKKPVKLPFLDFTTLPARRHFCKEELRLNRRLAAELYLDVMPIGGTPQNPRIGAEPAIEYAVRMVQFPPDARLDQRLAAGLTREAAIIALAETMGHFHSGLPPAAADCAYGTAAAVRAAVEKNFDETLAVLPDRLAHDSELHRFVLDRGRQLAPVLDRRREAGAVRECHGDLHLENLVDLQSRILPFDALEFDPELRWIDVLDETAFLTMDLAAHGRPDLACRYLSRYLEITGDYDGLEVLGYYLVHRALVRAKVRAIKARQDEATATAANTQPYLSLAASLAVSHKPLLVITHGLSGSGKTTWTDRLIGGLPAVRFRSDVVRKQLMGLNERASSQSPVGGGIYAAESTAATYGALERAARAALEAGLDVIVDAAFLQRRQRTRFLELAAEMGAAFAILHCLAPENVLRQRISERQASGSDASEAGVEVLEDQLKTSETLTSTELGYRVVVDTENPPSIEDVSANLRAAQCYTGQSTLRPT